MTWWRRKRDIERELAEARQAEAKSETSLTDARNGYREALRTAKRAQKINTRNHFSESLTRAYGG